MSSPDQPSVAVVLVNLGTPDAATPSAVRRFLRQFLSDQRVIEIPALIWLIILNVFVLPFRPRRVAKAYASIWQSDSPMRLILKQQTAQLQQLFSQQYQDGAVKTYAAMTYGSPALGKVLDDIHASGTEKVIIFPLFPQYSATSTGAVYDATQRWLATQRNLPSITLIKDYHDHPRYIQALASSVKKFWQQHGQAEKLLMSFHGIPQPYADKGDPYPAQCQQTAYLLAQSLGLSSDQWAISFQSRFGKQEWVKPYTNELLQQWGSSGVSSVQVISPAFSADCLETLEELAVENQHLFLQSGGKTYQYIPALNDDELHIDALFQIVKPFVSAYRPPHE
jgi:ferrochelatase